MKSVSNSPVFSIGTMIILLLILFGISFFITKKVLKKDKKFTIVVALIIWTVIFSINFILVSINRAPFFAIRTIAYLDGTSNGTYIGLGYKIKVEGYNIIGDDKETRKVEFVSIFSE